MNIPLCWLTCVNIGLAAAFAQAAPPAINSISPRGIERSKTTELVVSGSNLTNKIVLIFPFKALQKTIPDQKPNQGQVRIRVTVDGGAPLGIYPVLAATEYGISSYYLFSVDAFPNVNEVEDNNTFEKAQRISIPAIVTGQCAGGDVDYFRFSARKKQHLVIETECSRIGSGIIPQIRVTDGAKTFIASDDAQLLRGDCRIAFVVPADGEYVVEFSDSRYRGGTPPDYRLKIADYDVVEEVFPPGGRLGEIVEFTLRGGTLPVPVLVSRQMVVSSHQGYMPLTLPAPIKAGMLSPIVIVGELPERVHLHGAGKDPKALDLLPPITINSRLEHEGDVDRYQVAVKPGQRFRIELQADAIGSYLDAVLRIRNQAGTQLALVDDLTLPPAVPGLPSVRSRDPAVDLTVLADTTLLVIEVSDQRHRGGINFVYRLTVEAAVDDFALQSMANEINVPQSGSTVVKVAVQRTGFKGPIHLAMTGLPQSIVARGGHVPENGTAGLLTLTAPNTTTSDPQVHFVQIEGRALSNGQSVRRLLETRIPASQATGVAMPIARLHQLAIGLSTPEPCSINWPASGEVVAGYQVNIPVKLLWGKNQKPVPIDVSALPVQLASAPGGTTPAGTDATSGVISIKSTTLAAGIQAAQVTLTASTGALDPTYDVVLQGRAKINNADVIVMSPALTVTVHKPFTVDLSPVEVILQPGKVTSVKGHIMRKQVFKEPVDIKLEGIPQNISLANSLKMVGAGTKDFEISLKAAPNAGTLKTKLILKCSTKIGGQSYTSPPIEIPVHVAMKPGR